jgi:threonine dehydrogenase-like Zn-dependent dehydrogenase
MPGKLNEYRRADAALPDRYRLWPLYGAGFENLGRDGEPIEVPMPECGPDELLVRHDACSICFSDYKVLRAGQAHPRIYRDMKARPVVLGHEVTLTVVRVGEALRDGYSIGDRFIVQADIYVNGVNLAYGYEIQGGQSQYSVIDRRVLDGDDGNYLIPVQPGTGYAESALTEPWTCVLTAYRLNYRARMKPGGTAWIIGTDAGGESAYTIGSGFEEGSHPDRLLLTDVPADFARSLKSRAETLGIQVAEVDDVTSPPVQQVDDIVLLGPDPGLIESASPYLAEFGVFAIIAHQPLARKVELDVGRIHYNRWLYVGGPGPDVAQAYVNSAQSATGPARSTLKPGGRAWFVGAGGPMGRLHVQRAIEIPDGPRAILCTARSNDRLPVVESIYRADAEAKGIRFDCTSLADEDYQETLDEVGRGMFDDIVVLAPSAAAIEEAAEYLAPRGVMNIFAGVRRGTKARLDLSDVYLKGKRFIGHSGLTTENMRIALEQVETGEFSANRLAAAVGSLGAFRAGLRAVKDGEFSGKVVIFPHIKELPLTPLPDLRDKLPGVYAKLKNGREWTKEAEDEFLRLMLV